MAVAVMAVEGEQGKGGVGGAIVVVVVVQCVRRGLSEVLWEVMLVVSRDFHY